MSMTEKEREMMDAHEMLGQIEAPKSLTLQEPKKCESCLYFYNLFPENGFDRGWCENPRVLDAGGLMASVAQVSDAREICNKEGDGIFVYFEPKEPSAGAAVQPDDWRKEAHKHFGKAA